MFSNHLSANALPLIIDLVLTVLLIQPLCNFLVYGWKRKQEEVNNSLTSAAKRTYLEVFWNHTFAEGQTPKAKAAIAKEVDKEFADLYQRWYGRNRFIIPISILFLIAGFENFYLSSELIQLLTANGELSSAVAAIAGAYTFVTWDFFWPRATTKSGYGRYPSRSPQDGDRCAGGICVRRLDRKGISSFRCLCRRGLSAGYHQDNPAAIGQ
jgi:hypothetical protein